MVWRGQHSAGLDSLSIVIESGILAGPHWGDQDLVKHENGSILRAFEQDSVGTGSHPRH